MLVPPAEAPLALGLAIDAVSLTPLGRALQRSFSV